MNTKYITPILLIVALILGSYIQPPSVSTAEIEEQSKPPIYKLYPTKNNWTFLKLDTRNGKISQVLFTVSEDGSRGEYTVNSVAQVSIENQFPGRFELKETINIYNFLLLDQETGTVTQVQWSMERMSRGIMNEIKPFD
jgi:hypothetical protein